MRWCYTSKRRGLCQASVALALSAFTVAPVYALEWADLWSSAEQRAAKQLEKQQYDELIDNSPDASWRGLGEYRKGEYTAAAKSFEQRRAQAEEAGLVSDVERAMYNQANAHVLEENYEDAISLFDELLEANPEHDNAEHNRDIAQQLYEQQQQEQQQQESDEQGEQNDENQSESDDQQESQSGDGEQSEGQDSEQDDSAEQDDQQSSQSGEQQAESDSQNTDSNAEDESASAQEQAEQAAAAEAAMEAERARQDEVEPNENASESEAAPPVAPLTEREQANEQWLRQIPDDPAGLLQRKIQNRHQTDFPKVQDSDEPW